VIEYQFTQGNGCAAAGAGLNGLSGPPDCVSPIAVTAGRDDGYVPAGFLVGSAVWTRAALTSSVLVFACPARPTALGRLGQQHPGPAGKGGVAGRGSDDVGEPADDRELLVAV
jgi:hypothetical protein